MAGSWLSRLKVWRWRTWREDLVLIAGIGGVIWGAITKQVEMVVAFTGMIAGRAAFGRDKNRPSDDDP
jgi:hypothetical protein